MKLLADSGSTKTLWMVVNEQGESVCDIFTDGLNPFYQTAESVQQTIENQLLPSLSPYPIDEVYFYGAGCAFPEKNAIIAKGIQAVFPTAGIEIASDLLGAARGLCGNDAGIVCILGTGSNSCFYENGNIVQNVSPLGFILGDEGSGAVLGKVLVGDFLKHQMPKHLAEDFQQQFNLTPAEILDKVYKQAFPNRFLASFTPFLKQHIEEPYCVAVLTKSFTDFFTRNIHQYDYSSQLVHCTGSIAFHFEAILKDVAEKQGIKMGVIEQMPMNGLVRFHAK